MIDGIPQKLTFVTLGAHDVPALRDFYRSWGWAEGEGGGDMFAQFLLANTRFALYRADLLAAEAAPDLQPRPPGTFSGVTLALNVGSAEEVDAVFAAAVAAGATAVGGPVDREWGGRSGYLSDPEGNRWEVAWLPGYTP